MKRDNHEWEYLTVSGILRVEDEEFEIRVEKARRCVKCGKCQKAEIFDIKNEFGFFDIDYVYFDITPQQFRKLVVESMENS